MKKLVFMLATVACAATMQAASFSWGGDKLYGVTAASVVDNGSYGAASSGTTDRGDKVLSALTYVLTIYDATGTTEIGSASGTVTYGSLGKVALESAIDVSEAAQGTTYKYVLALTGAQSNIRSRGEETSGEYKYDYSAATIAAELTGDITTATMGVTTLDAGVPSTWTVSGITKTPVGGGGGGGSGVPEPTSGLLLALGGAMLALRRKR